MRIIKILPLFILFLTGCYDMTELEDRAFVVSMGIDKEEKDYVVFLAIPNIESLGTETSKAFKGEGMQGSKTVYEGRGRTISEAITKIDSRLGKELYLGHLKLCLFSKEILKDENMFSGSLNYLENNREIGSDIIVMGTNKPKNILEIKARDNIMVALTVRDFYKNNDERCDVSFLKELDSLISDIDYSKNTIIPLVSEENKDIKIGGAYIIKDGVYISDFTETDVKGILYLMDKNIREITRNDKSIEIKKMDRKIGFSYNNELYLNVEINLEAMGQAGGEEFEKEAENQIITSLNKLKKLNSDALNLSRLIYKNHYDLYEKNIGVGKNFNPELNVDVNIKFIE